MGMVVGLAAGDVFGVATDVLWALLGFVALDMASDGAVVSVLCVAVVVASVVTSVIGCG